MIESVTKIVDDLDKKHAKERHRLSNMETKDLLALMPNLVIFHQDLKQGYSEKKEEDEKYATQNIRRMKYYVDSDSDESIVDMPWDAKVS